MKIFVNGWPTEVEADTSNPSLTYERIVALANDHGNPTITYRGPTRGDLRREGTLHRGQVIIIEPEMRFSVAHTGDA